MHFMFAHDGRKYVLRSQHNKREKLLNTDENIHVTCTKKEVGSMQVDCGFFFFFF